MTTRTRMAGTRMAGTRTGRVAATTALTLTGALVLAACGIGGSSGGSGGTDSASGEVKGSITFQTWNLKSSYSDYFTKLIASFEKQHPGTTVKWVDQPAEGYQDKLSADAAAGNLPDVVDVGPEAAYTLSKAHLLLDVSKADPSAKSRYLPKAWDADTFDSIDGGTYALPWYLNTGPSFFNEALLKKCGVDTAKLPKTYEELFAAADAMSKECSDKFSMIGRLPVIEMFGSYGVQLMNDDHTEFTFNNARGVKLVDSFRKLYQGRGLTAEALDQLQTGETDKFKAGEVAWLPGSSYTLKDLKATAPDVYKNVKVAPLITDDKPNMYIESLGVNATSKNKATAMAFAKFVTDRKNQVTFTKTASVFPSAAGALDDPYFTKDDGSDDASVRIPAAAQIATAQVYWPAEFSAQDVSYLRQQVAQAVLGKKSAKAALDAAVSYANDKLSAK